MSSIHPACSFRCWARAAVAASLMRHHDPPPPPPPLRPPPNPPKPPPNPPDDPPLEAAAEAAAKRAHAARPAAPVVAPGAPPASAAHHAAHDEEQHEHDDGPWDRKARVAITLARAPRRDVLAQRLALPFGDAGRQPLTAGEQPAAVVPLLEIRHHRLPAGLAAEAVGDVGLEAVADFDPHLPVVHGEQHEQAVVLALDADAAAGVLEHLHRVAADVGLRLEGLDRGDDQDVAGGLLQPVRQTRDRVAIGGVDHAGEVVDGAAERGRRLRARRQRAQQQREKKRARARRHFHASTYHARASAAAR